MLLLDQAEYRMDNGPWQPREEVLRVDNLLREALGYPLKMAAFPQPWTLHGQGRREEHRLGLRFTVRSQLALEGVKLAVERPQALRSAGMASLSPVSPTDGLPMRPSAPCPCPRSVRERTFWSWRCPTDLPPTWSGVTCWGTSA